MTGLAAFVNPLSLAVLATAALSASRGSNAWLRTTWLATLLAAVSLALTPRLVLSLTTRVPLDPVSIHATRLLGSALLSVSFAAYFARQDDHDHGRAAVFRSQAVTSAILLAAMIYAQVHYKEWSDGHISLGIVGVAAWLLPSVYFHLQALDGEVTETSGRYEVFLSIDYLATFILGVAWCAFPQWLMRYQLVRKPNGVSVHVMRMLGAVMIGSSQLSQAAVSFPNNKTKKTVLLSRIAGSLLFIPMIVYSQLQGSFNLLHVVTGVTGAGLWAANAFLGCMIIDFVEKLETEQWAQRYSQVQNAEVSQRGQLGELKAHNSILARGHQLTTKRL